MSNIILHPAWSIPESETTPEDVFMNRRKFMKSAGAATIALSAITACGDSGTEAVAQTTPKPVGPAPTPAAGLYPSARNEAFTLDRPLTDEKLAAGHNNFYEFANAANGRDYQQRVAKVSEGYHFRPWEVEITGLCDNPVTLTIDEIEKLAPLEERLYRFRCVEAWAMAVPWTGYSLSHLLDHVKPKAEAKYVRFVSFHDPELPGVSRAPYYNWPYYEGLTMAEAMNEITLLCTGIYGHALPPQHGAPVRIIAPWKYGYKSPKSIARIELVAERPGTFWNDLQANEYSFTSNVDPEVPHPRWSQATEWTLGDRRTRRPTLKYNGYGDYVAGLYA